MISAFLKLSEEQYQKNIENRNKRIRWVVRFYAFLRYFGFLLMVLWIPSIVFIVKCFGWTLAILFALISSISFLWFYGYCWPKILTKWKREIFMQL